MIVAFTGHRPDKLGFWDPLHPVVERIRKTLRDELARDWPLYAISGMALGFDQWAAETCLELGIPFVAALACDDWASQWPHYARARAEKLLDKAKEVVVVSTGPFKPWKMQRRNEFLVDHCNKLISVFDGSAGGTYNCLAYAAEVGRDVKQLEWRVDAVSSVNAAR